MNTVGQKAFREDGKNYTAEKIGGQYIVKIANIPAHELGETHAIDVTDANGTAHVEVSALSYVKSMLEACPDGASQKTAAAICFCAAAAEAFRR